jgi:hypothetical protein
MCQSTERLVDQSHRWHSGPDHIDRVTHGRGRAGPSTSDANQRKIDLAAQLFYLFARGNVPGTVFVQALHGSGMERHLGDPFEDRPELLR